MLTKKPKDIVDRETIREADLDERPAFYDSPTNNPVAEVVRNNENVYNNVFRVLKIFETEVEIPAATFDFFFFTIIPGTVTLSQEHGVKGRIPIVEIYTPTLLESIVIPNANTDDEKYTSTIYNYNTAISGTFTIRGHVYQVLNKTRS